MPELILDPAGYFLIRVNHEKKATEIAFCRYDEIKFTNLKARFGKNIVNKKFSSEHYKKILEWIKENKLCTKKDHYNYLKKELKKAEECMQKGEKYVQD